MWVMFFVFMCVSASQTSLGWKCFSFYKYDVFHLEMQTLIAGRMDFGYHALPETG